MATAPDETLWSLIESRDRAFAKAHEAFQSLTWQAGQKDEEIARLKQAADRKDEEIHMLTRSADEWQVLVRELEASWEYKLGLMLLHPWAVVRQKVSADPQRTRHFRPTQNSRR